MARHYLTWARNRVARFLNKYDDNDLRKVRRLIKAGWIKGHYAKDLRGVTKFPTSEDACSYCLSGAIGAVQGKNIGRSDLYQLVANALPNPSAITIPAFNDAEGTTKRDVLAVIDKAMGK